MAGLQMLKSSPSDYSHAKFGCFCSEFNSNSLMRKSLRLQNPGIKLDYRRFRVSCNVESNSQSNGEESPEFLFMKELRRRGMAPTYSLEGENRIIYRDDQIKLREEEEDGDWSYSRTNGFTADAETNLYNQQGTSMALNSEGVEDYVPRTKLLLTLGGAFFFGWPLILLTIATFSALSLYFGPIIPPLYIDPYAVLEEETIYKIAPLLN